MSLTDDTLCAPEFIRGPGQVTDVYLLGLARKMGGLATLDRTIPLKAVKGATQSHLCMIEPTE